MRFIRIGFICVILAIMLIPALPVHAMGGTAISINLDQTGQSYNFNWYAYTGNNPLTTAQTDGVLNGTPQPYIECVVESGQVSANDCLLAFAKGAVNINSLTAATITTTIGATIPPHQDASEYVGIYGYSIDPSVSGASLLSGVASTGVLLTSEVQDQGLSANQTLTFTFNATGLAYIKNYFNNSAQFVRFLICGREIGQGLTITDTNSGYFNSISFVTTASGIQLNLSYVAQEAVARTFTLGTNGTVGTQVANGNLTGIYWDTPRCAFNNENVQFYAASTTEYLTMSLAVMDANGNTLCSQATCATTTATVSINGVTNYVYYYTIQIPNNYTGYFRCVESNRGTKSDWGYSSKPLSALMPTESVTINDINYPQNQNKFSDYVSNAPDQTFIFYWITDISSNDLTNNYPTWRLYKNGINYVTNPGDTLWNSNAANLETYEECSSANNGTLGVGYAIMTFYGDSAFSSLNNLIINLALTPSAANWGFYQPVIWNYNTSSELTTALSASWYLQSGSTGLSIKIIGNPANVAPDALQTIDISASTDTGLATNLSALALSEIQPNNTTLATSNYTITQPDQQYTFAPGAAIGSWLIQTSFAKAGCSFTYTYQIPLTVGSSGAGIGGITTTDVIQNIDTTVSEHGWGSAGAHWLIVIILMVVVMVIPLVFIPGIFKIVMVVLFPMLVLGLAIASQFVDLWLVILIGIVAAAIIATIAVKAMSGGGSG